MSTTTPQPTPANPDKGGSYTRCPVTGELTAAQQPEPADSALRHAALDAQDPAAEAPQAPAVPADPPTQPEA